MGLLLEIPHVIVQQFSSYKDETSQEAEFKTFGQEYFTFLSITCDDPQCYDRG